MLFSFSFAAWAADPPPKPAVSPKPAPAKPAADAKPASAPQPGASKPAASSPDKPPPGKSAVPGQETKETLPGPVTLSPEEYQRLLDENKELKRQLDAKPEKLLSKCELSGRVEGDLVHLKAQFTFVTNRPRSLIALGCQKAWPTAAKWGDGRLPVLLPSGEDGFLVQVDTSGEHQLTLDMDIPLAARGTEGTDRGFELDLPRAAITRLGQFDVPSAVRQVQIRGRGTQPELNRLEQADSLSSKNSRRESIALGAISLLEVSWKGPAPVQQAEPLLAAQGTVTVQVNEADVVTVANLTLEVRRGRTNQWLLQAPPPPQGSVEVLVPPQDERVPAVLPPTDPKNPVWTIRLKEPSAEPLRVEIRVQQPRASKAPAPPVPVGPFTVLNAFRQQGTIKVTWPPEVRLGFRTRGEISRGEAADDQGRDTTARFTYWNLPVRTNPAQPAAVPLELEIESVKGMAATRLTHTLSLKAEQGYRVTTRIDVMPIHTGVERLEVELPPDFQYDGQVGGSSSPADLVENPVDIKDVGPQRRVAQVKLFQKQYKPFSVTLPGRYPLPADVQQASLALPRPVGTLDRGGEVKVSLPEGLELLTARESGSETLSPGKREHAWSSERAPARAELAWGRHRPELPVDAVVDITLTDRQALVRHSFHFPQGAPKQILFRVPTTLADPLSVKGPDALVPKNEDRTIWELTPKEAKAWPPSPPTPSPAAAGEGAGGEGGIRREVFPLEYSFSLPKPNPGALSRRFAVPLVWPAQASRCATKVRLWSDPGTQPILAGGAWEEQPTETVPGQNTLPALVLRGTGLDTPLSLRLEESAAKPQAAVVADVLLVQVLVAEGGYRSYRARFGISRLAARFLDIELPASPARLNLEVLLDGKGPFQLQTVDETGKETEGGHIARLRIQPELYQNRQPVILDIRYQSAPGLVDRREQFRTVLAPPLLRGNAFVGRVCWQVGLPPGLVPVYQQGADAADQRWKWRSWLLVPRAERTSADLERWFFASLKSPARDPKPEADADPGVETLNSGLVFWQAAPEPFRLLHVPQRAWLLACSLALLVVGLGGYFVPLRRSLFWSAAAGLGLSAVVAAVLWPGVLSAVMFGCEPGALVLVLVFGVQWLLHRRYRRQVLFLPGFTRLKPGSSLVRKVSIQRPRGEPSTVDAPPGSSPKAVGSGP